ncbi:MAG: prepilin-type N-terminal cleavage/methylation domain-containing protein [Clostridia bacterium]
MKKTNKKKGFTLVELLIVIVIIGILAGVLIPTMSGVIKRAHISTVTSAIGNLNTTLATLRVEGLTLEDISEYGEVSAPKLRNALIKEEAVNAEQLDKFNVAYNNGYSVFFDSATFTFVLKSQEDIIANNSYVKATNNPFGLQTTYAETVSQDQDYAFPQNSIIKGMTFMNYLSKADRSNADALLNSLSIYQDIMAGEKTSVNDYLLSLAGLSKKTTQIGTAENALLMHALSRVFIDVTTEGLKKLDPSTLLSSYKDKLAIGQLAQLDKLPVLPTLQAMLDNGVAKAYVLPSNIFEGYSVDASLSLTIPENIVLNVGEIITSMVNNAGITMNVTPSTKTTTSAPSTDGTVASTAIVTVEQGGITDTTNSVFVQVATDTSKVVTVTNNITNGILVCLGKEYSKGSTFTVPVGSKNISVIVKGANGFRPELITATGLNKTTVDNQYLLDTATVQTITVGGNFTIPFNSTYAVKLTSNLEHCITDLTKSSSLLNATGDLTFTARVSNIPVDFRTVKLYLAGQDTGITTTIAGDVYTFTVTSTNRTTIDNIISTLTLDRNRTLNFVIEVYVDVNATTLGDVTTAINNGSLSTNGLLFKQTTDLTVTNPIGNEVHAFAGIFDGKGKNTTINITNTNQHVGMFAYVGATAEIKNVNVTSAIISNTTKGSSIGVIAGYSLGKVTNCNVTGTITITADVSSTIGSIVGSQITTLDNSNNTLTNCTCAATITINGTAVTNSIPLIGKEIKKP